MRKITLEIEFTGDGPDHDISKEICSYLRGKTFDFTDFHYSIYDANPVPNDEEIWFDPEYVDMD